MRVHIIEDRSKQYSTFEDVGQQSMAGLIHASNGAQIDSL